MSCTAKKRSVKFCPFCGSDLISHVSNGVFFCGQMNPTEESVKVQYATGKKLCGRIFRVVYSRRVNANELRRRFNDIQQILVRKGEIPNPPRRGTFLNNTAVR